jgi:hypothetical protein
VAKGTSPLSENRSVPWGQGILLPFEELKGSWKHICNYRRPKRSMDGFAVQSAVDLIYSLTGS